MNEAAPPPEELPESSAGEADEDVEDVADAYLDYLQARQALLAARPGAADPLERQLRLMEVLHGLAAAPDRETCSTAGAPAPPSGPPSDRPAYPQPPPADAPPSEA